MDDGNDNKRTVFVGNLPREVNKREIEDVFGEIGPIKRCYIQYPRSDRKNKSQLPTVAYVTFAIAQDAAQAIEKLSNHTFGDRRVNLKLSNSRTDQSRSNFVLRPPPSDSVNSIPIAPKEKVPRPKPINKKSRLILRNLSFQITEQKIRHVFSTCGEIKEVNILKKPSGKLVGCAFIQYANVHQAIDAIKQLNYKELLGRPVAVDWAIPKKEFQKEGEDEIKPEPMDEDKKDFDTDIKVKDEPVDDYSVDFNTSDVIEIDAEVKEENDVKPRSLRKKKLVDNSSDDDGSDNELSKKRPKLGNDVEEGKTLFVRNLEFDTTEDQLKTFFEQFGKVHYALLCKDKLTEHPKGTAFVKFKELDAAQQCHNKSSEDPTHFILGRRQFYLSVAIAKDKLNKQVEETTVKKEKDGRNLFLAREGFIRPGSSGAEGVSAADMNLRATQTKVKKQMLKNLNIFISRTRLCVHNLSPQFTDKQLRELFATRAGPDAKITEAKIMRDMKDTDLVTGVGKSKGFGFVSFIQHEHALKALREINNNPKIFTVNRRPIVEFSLENQVALKAKLKRMEKSKEGNSNRKQGEKKIENKEAVEEDDKQTKTKAKKSKDEKIKNKIVAGDSKELPDYSGLTAKKGVSKLPLMRSKGKITRNSLKPRKNKRTMQQQRRMREPKSKPLNGSRRKEKEDVIDKMVSKRRKQTSAEESNNKQKWYD